MRDIVASWRAGCPYCGGEIDYTGRWDLDEILPRALGGDPLDLANVRAAHTRCNRAAGAGVKRYTGWAAPLDQSDW